MRTHQGFRLPELGCCTECSYCRNYHLLGTAERVEAGERALAAPTAQLLVPLPCHSVTCLSPWCQVSCHPLPGPQGCLTIPAPSL